ncbi:hypothetical protein BGZ99_010268, partial [Dissophora globulifera]
DISADQPLTVSRHIGLTTLPETCLTVYVTIHALWVWVVRLNHADDLRAVLVVIAAEFSGATATALSFNSISLEWIMLMIDSSSWVAGRLDKNNQSRGAVCAVRVESHSMVGFDKEHGVGMGAPDRDHAALEAARD